MTRDEKESTLLKLLPGVRMQACKFARRFRLDHNDCVQEACLAAWKSLELFDASLGFTVWTYMERWVGFALLNLSRRRAKQRERESALPVDVAEHRREWSAMEFGELLEPCRPRDREVMRALYVEGLTQQEIGEREGVTHQMIGLIHRRALTTIRAKRRDLRK